LVEEDLPEFLSVVALTTRWSVSRKTLERMRRRGLIAQRYRDDDRVVHLAFTLSAIEDYEKRQGESVRAAGGFDRIEPEAVARLAQVGDRAMRRFGWSLNDTAEKLATRTGRGRETMRQLLARSTQREASGALGPRERRIIDRASQRSVPITVIATRYDRTPDAIRLIVNQRRLSRLRRWRLPVASSIGDDAFEAMLEHPLLRAPVRRPGATTIGAFLEEAVASGKPDAKAERVLAAVHRGLLARAGVIARSMSRSSPRAIAIDRAEADLRFAAIVRRELIRSELGMVKSAIEGRLGVTLASLAPRHAILAHDAAIDALIVATGSFDPTRGGRLAASAGLAINKALAPVERTIREQPDPRGGAGETPQAGLRDWTRRVAPWCRWLDLPPGFEQRIGALPSPGDKTIALLHGLLSGPPLSAGEIAEELGLSRVAVVRSIGDGMRSLRQSVRDGGLLDEGSTDDAPTSVR
jgi:hypothetical protein